ncbi:hypothetical protein [Halorussus halophilus]|uniref:hypothetical protein n=1 Tax=Halorussus halophilus TaxID=2650975 RepID=UPI0017887EB0|nr:hypothetical protein [Halorussus halophilus]
MGLDCTYCGCDVEAHDPVYVEERVEGAREQTGQFCNYGCLSAHVEAEELATGTVCNLE